MRAEQRREVGSSLQCESRAEREKLETVEDLGWLQGCGIRLRGTSLELCQEEEGQQLNLLVTEDKMGHDGSNIRRRDCQGLLPDLAPFLHWASRLCCH